MTHPFAVLEGCCSDEFRVNDPALDPACDGSALAPTDPAVCCPGSSYTSVPDCENGLTSCQTLVLPPREYPPVL